MLRLLHPRRWSLGVLAAAIVLAFVIGGIVAERVMRSRQSLEDRARGLAVRGDAAGAEALYWELIERGPVTVPLLVAFLDNHARLSAPTLEMSEDGEELKLKAPATSPDEARVDALLQGDRLPPDVAPLGRYWRKVRRMQASEVDREPIVRAADAEPPLAWANHLLAIEATLTARTDDAALRFEREGLFFGASAKDERADDLERAIEMWIASEAWDKVGSKLADPRYDKLVRAPTRLRYALHARDWKSAVRWFLPANVPDWSPGVFGLAGLSALSWFWFCARVGQLGERPKFRVPLYVAALLLGVASVYMTLALVYVEEIFLHFHEKKNAIANAIYFVLGVGLREELSKLVFFAPLLPIIRKWGGRREVVACGALVGLGFAAEENIGYFDHGSLSTALVRFLTANFFHMSTAAISATALYDFSFDREKHTPTLSRAFLLVMGIHGLYDFFLSFPKWSFLSMVGFVLISRQFLALVRDLRGTKARGVSLLTRFVVALSVLSGAGFVYGTFLAGPAMAARAMAEGLLGLAVIIYFFVQELEAV